MAKIQNEKDLLKAREDVLHSFNDLVLTEEEVVDECIQDVKCTGSCTQKPESNEKDERTMW